MSSEKFITPKRAQMIFASQQAIDASEAGKSFPPFARSPSDGRALKSWSLQELPMVGEKIGFLTRPKVPLVFSMFVTKGGVLKTSLTLNLARMAALHGIKTCVIGLDMQGDITAALGFEGNADESDTLEAAVAKMNSVRGLAEIYSSGVNPSELLQPTDLPNLFYIPETPELVSLDQSLIHRNRREYWLKENVVEPLKASFDLILLDCSPNWNRLITNALIASDVLISPLECKINNFRNLKLFQTLIAEFRREMHADFQQLFVPTRLAASRKLSVDILDYYRETLPECVSTAIRENSQGEEASATYQSVIECAPTSDAADEMRAVAMEIWKRVPLFQTRVKDNEANVWL